MPVYNGEHFLPEAIDSILGQTFRDIELLIIDDGSTDRSADIIQAYDDPRIRLVRNSINLGLVAALNKGLDLARGDYIARMDCDDIALPSRLEKQVRFMDGNPDVGLCGTFYQWFSGDLSKTVRLPEDDQSIRLTLAFENSFGHNTVMLRRRHLSELGLKYDPAFKYAEDYEFWVRCSHYMKMANLPEVLVRYRFHPENTSSVYRGEQQQTADRIRRMQLDLLGLAATPEELAIHQQLAQHCFAGSIQELTLARNWLEKFTRTLAVRSSKSTESVHQRLGLNWYLACSQVADLGLPVWRLFMSSQIGRRADPIYVGKLFVRCLLRRPIPTSAPANDTLNQAEIQP